MTSAFIVAVLLFMSLQVGSGQVVPAPAPALDCNGELLDLLPCYQFLSNMSVTTPSPVCCGGLTNVSVSSPACLCQFISPSNVNQSASLGINVTRALELPGFCQLNVSPSDCTGVAGEPGLAPSPSALVPSVSPAPLSPPSSASVPAPALVPARPPSGPATVPSVAPQASVSAPPPAVDCNSQLVPLTSCLQYVTGQDPAPSSTCCTNLASTSPNCLCSLVTSAGSGVPIAGVNITLALGLPELCNVSASLATCLGAGTSPPPAGGPSPPSGVDDGHAIVSMCRSFGTILILLVVTIIVPH